MKRQPRVFSVTVTSSDEKTVETFGLLISKQKSVHREQFLVCDVDVESSHEQLPARKNKGSNFLKWIVGFIIMLITFMIIYPFISYLVVCYLNWFEKTTFAQILGLTLSADLITLAVDKSIDLLFRIMDRK